MIGYILDSEKLLSFIQIIFETRKKEMFKLNGKSMARENILL